MSWVSLANLRKKLNEPANRIDQMKGRVSLQGIHVDEIIVSRSDESKSATPHRPCSISQPRTQSMAESDFIDQTSDESSKEL